MKRKFRVDFSITGQVKLTKLKLAELLRDVT